jgi:hypothetical protein
MNLTQLLQSLEILNFGEISSYPVEMKNKDGSQTEIVCAKLDSVNHKIVLL